MKIKELIKELSKYDQEAYVAIETNEDDGIDNGIREVRNHGEKVRLNQMKGWGDDRIFPDCVLLTLGDEMVVMDPNEIA